MLFLDIQDEQGQKVVEEAVGGLDVLAHIAAIDRHNRAEDFTLQDMQFF